MMAAWSAIPSVSVKAMNRGDVRATFYQNVRKGGKNDFMVPFDAIYIQNLPFNALFAPRNTSQVPISHVRQPRRWQNLFVMEAYQKIPMDTAGAYRLIDDETGENFIIWGDIDGDSSIPAKEALSWRPLDEARQGGVKIVSSSLGSFSRLKIPKIRALMKNSSQAGIENSMNSIKSSTHVMSVGEPDSVHSYTNFAAPDIRHQIASSRSVSRKELGACDAHVSFVGVNSPFRQWNDVRPTSNIDVAKKKYRKELLHDSGFFSRKSFRDLGCNDFMIESLEKQSISRPSNIQAMAYGAVLEGKSCIIADQSGSGKTLAYLAPVIQRLREEELSGIGKSSSKNPRVVILSPTAELASQVHQICRLMARSGVPFRSVVATGGFRQKTQFEALQQELDILIATPGRFMFLLQEGFFQLNNLKSVVLDEVDILLGDEGFDSVLQSFIRSAPVDVQYLFVTATLPINIYRKLVEVFPDCEVVMGPGIHRTSSRLDEILLDCSGAEGEERNPDTAFLNKKTALLKLVEESPVPKTIVFCNKIETCRKVENALKRFDRQGIRLKTLPFHAALSQELRLSNMKEFLKSELKESMFLVSSDRASRGIDFENVDHVVLFDFPRDPSEYVRRVGRTARGAAGRGKAFVFAVGKQVSLAKKIIERNKKGHPLHDVPKAYELLS